MNETDDILKSLDDKTPRKKPSNWALYAALYFAEFIFVLLDAGSAVSVGMITGYWYYGVIVFLAGVIPLFLHTKLYTRPLASKEQKSFAVIGGVVAVGSVFVMAVFVAILNFAAQTFTAVSIVWMEAGLGISLVILITVHAFLAAGYFFIDEQINEANKTERIIARGNAQVQRILAAQEVANAKQREVRKRKQLESMFTPEVVQKILSMMADDDGDGIPNFIDPVDNRQMKRYAQDTPKVQIDPKDNGGQGQNTP